MRVGWQEIRKITRQIILKPAALIYKLKTSSRIMPRKYDVYIEKDIARQRIEILMGMASRLVHVDKGIARRCARIALRISKKANIRVSKKYKIMICKKCHVLLIPGLNSRVRIRQNRMPHITITCLECGYRRRIPFIREKRRN